MLLWPLAKLLTSPRNAKPSKPVDDALTARLAVEGAALKRAWTRLDWELKSDAVKPPVARFWTHHRSLNHLACGHALARTKLYVEVALHEQAIALLSNVPVPQQWRQHLRRDVRYRALAFQAKWLGAVLAEAKTELASTAAFRRRSADDYVMTSPQVPGAWAFHDDMVPNMRTQSRWQAVLELPLHQVLPPNDHTPSNAYLSFELFLLETGFEKAEVGQRLRHIAATAYSALQPPPMPPLHCLIHEISSHLIREHGLLPPCRRSTLDCLVRQMIHVRLAGAYCRADATALATAARRFDAIKPRMHELAIHDLCEVHIQQEMALPQTRAALEAMPTFMPDAIVAAYMAAISTLHGEVAAALQVPASSLSADVILPCLVGLFGQANLPHLVLQVHAMEQHATAYGEGEVAYYVALAQAALGAT